MDFFTAELLRAFITQTCFAVLQEGGRVCRSLPAYVAMVPFAYGAWTSGPGGWNRVGKSWSRWFPPRPGCCFISVHTHCLASLETGTSFRVSELSHLASRQLWFIPALALYSWARLGPPHCPQRAGAGVWTTPELCVSCLLSARLGSFLVYQDVPFSQESIAIWWGWCWWHHDDKVINTYLEHFPCARHWASPLWSGCYSILIFQRRRLEFWEVLWLSHDRPTIKSWNLYLCGPPENGLNAEPLFLNCMMQILSKIQVTEDLKWTHRRRITSRWSMQRPCKASAPSKHWPRMPQNVTWAGQLVV